MRFGALLIVVSVGLLSLTACGETGVTGAAGDSPQVGQQADAAPTEHADASVAQFLEAVRLGDDVKAAGMLTDLARLRTSEMDMVVSPPGSETASYEVKDIEHVADNEAHVLSLWSDVDEQGETHTDEIVWLLKAEAGVWRIYGMATQLFENTNPVLLNFEKPEEMMEKQRVAERELMQRVDQQRLQAEAKQPPTGTIQQ